MKTEDLNNSILNDMGELDILKILEGEKKKNNENLPFNKIAVNMLTSTEKGVAIYG